MEWTDDVAKAKSIVGQAWDYGWEKDGKVFFSASSPLSLPVMMQLCEAFNTEGVDMDYNHSSCPTCGDTSFDYEIRDIGSGVRWPLPDPPKE